MAAAEEKIQNPTKSKIFLWSAIRHSKYVSNINKINGKAKNITTIIPYNFISRLEKLPLCFKKKIKQHVCN